MTTINANGAVVAAVAASLKEPAAVNIEVFARQLIADKCSALIESEGMLPVDVLAIVKRARDDYFKNPSNKNYECLKRLFSQTKYVDDAVDYKDFHRRMLLIAFKFALSRGKLYFKSYASVVEIALKRLDTINPDLKSSPRAMLQHYNECLENLDNPRNDEHHLITFGKEIATKIFIETIDMYSYGTARSPFELNVKKIHDTGKPTKIMAMAINNGDANGKLLAAAVHSNMTKNKANNNNMTKNTIRMLDTNINKICCKAVDRVRKLKRLNCKTKNLVTKHKSVKPLFVFNA
ncbi:ac106 [Lambdina fiscellaria nucleopolyhedrovirus]|uniref:Ac106 n=1 Tax=Lambdina fiscellaria nucleopolyhedrovirus TaxID=1642929 RepID=A0A0E3Z895_9ABAC|nr:ac106 [Lambdina fiscellaria nucleopolyhedrovirus]AKC91667.1 ac106 [Lambdina fiscellaria nucleopolyhedrovirus]